jgi:hypothetical protein
MPEGPKTIITSLSEILPSHMYNVNTPWDNCSINLSAQTLLDIAAYAQANHVKLEREALENIENLYDQPADTVEMRSVSPEWRYKTSDLPLSPLPTGDRSADEGVEHALGAQSADMRDMSQISPEWRYKTSDLQLSPPPTGGKSADEGVEHALGAQSADMRDMSQISPEWRYKTSDLRL